MKITCVVANLGPGGAERVMTYLCGGLAARGHQVTLLTLSNAVPDFYAVPEGVERVRLDLPPFAKAGCWGGFWRLWLMIKALRRLKPDVLISFMTVSILGAALLLRIPYIYADHLDVRTCPWSPKWQFLRRVLLRFASRVTVLSERDRKYLAFYYPQWKTSIIYNPALSAPSGDLPRPDVLPQGQRYVLAVGRLVKQKGFDYLLEAWRRVCEEFPSWCLCIIGSGPLEAELKDLAEVLDVQHSVQFLPPQESLAAFYRYSDIYAMTSRTEGFPMVLLEAMASGLPVVSFACNGPDVIVRDGVDGLLVKPGYSELFAKSLARLMKDEDFRQRLARQAPQVCERFSLEKYIQSYEDLCTAARK